MRSRLVFAVIPLLLLFAVMTVVRSQENKRLTVIASAATYSVPVTDINGTEYVSAMDLLRPLGTLTLDVNKKKQKLHFTSARAGTVEAEIEAGKAQVKVGRNKIDLGTKIAIENGTAYIPLRATAQFISTLMPVSRPILHTAGRRLLIDQENPVRVDVRSDPAGISMQFAAPVHPKVQQRTDGITIGFTADPVIGFADTQTLAIGPLQTMQFSEQNGDAELLIKSTAALTVSLEDNDRRIVVRPTAPVLASKPVTPLIPTAVLPAVPAPPAASVKPVVVIDAAHGGVDGGATLAGGALEKDATLSFARKLRAELQSKGLTINMLRDSDALLTPDQRAEQANVGHPVAYVALHVAPARAPVRLYTEQVSGTPRAVFVPWDKVQSAYLARSKSLSGELAVALASSGPVDSREAMLPTLKSIMAPAVAIEMPDNMVADPAAQDSLVRQISRGIVEAAVQERR
jgi:N-acetylmuramoyl-L-alanine amidase